MDTNTVQLVESFGNKLDSYIQVLASKAGVAADHFYPIFVRQQVIEGWIAVGSYVTIILLLLIAMRFLFSNLKPAVCEDEQTSGPVLFKCIISCIMVICFFIVVLFSFPCLKKGIGQINNPEYAAVQSLVELVDPHLR